MAHDSVHEKKDARNKGRGSVDNAKRLQGLGKQRAAADWSIADPKHTHAVILAASEAGGAVRFGLSRDGGAYSLGCYLDGDSTTLYCNAGDDLEAFLREVYQFFTDAIATAKDVK